MINELEKYGRNCRGVLKVLSQHLSVRLKNHNEPQSKLSLFGT
jgi:hypothetical protein